MLKRSIKRRNSGEYRYLSMFKRLSRAARRRGEDLRPESWSGREREIRLGVLEWALRSVDSDMRLFQRLSELFPDERRPDSRIMFLRELVDALAPELGGRKAVLAAISSGDRWLSGGPGES
jgi:hypothetical protein